MMDTMSVGSERHPQARTCGRCGRSNPPGARFCGGCGEPLSQVLACPVCRARASFEQDFCTACGSALALHGAERAARGGAARISASEPLPQDLTEKVRHGGSELAGERKQVTVLFADVQGSMDLAGALDPEEWRAIMDRFLKILSAGVTRFEGTVDKFTGDGIMAVFGAPIAHEDHARRASYAALQMLDDVSEYAAELRREQGLNFSVRIGINSGEVVAGQIGGGGENGGDYTAIGHTVGLAQRMEALAEPGKAYLTESAA